MFVFSIHHIRIILKTEILVSVFKVIETFLFLYSILIFPHLFGLLNVIYPLIRPKLCHVYDTPLQFLLVNISHGLGHMMLKRIQINYSLINIHRMQMYTPSRLVIGRYESD